jgi:hypothetical protein
MSFIPDLRVNINNARSVGAARFAKLPTAQRQQQPGGNLSREATAISLCQHRSKELHIACLLLNIRI